MMEYKGYIVVSGFAPKKEDIDVKKSAYETLMDVIDHKDINKEATNAK